MKAVLSQSPLVLIDEITAAVSDDDVNRLLRVLRRLSQERAVLFVTHNERHARAVANRTALLAPSGIVEESEGALLWSNPRTEAGRTFVATRHGLNELRRTPDEFVQSLPDATESLQLLVPMLPSTFRWLVPATIGGLGRPGLDGDVEAELAGLAAEGVTLVVGLEESPTVPLGHLYRFDLAFWHFPIPDMSTPKVGDLVTLLEKLKNKVSDGECVAVHCRAGCGRTGLVLAGWSIFEGQEPAAALSRVRSINPRWVESAEQERFLPLFARHVASIRRKDTSNVD